MNYLSTKLVQRVLALFAVCPVNTTVLKRVHFVLTIQEFTQCYRLWYLAFFTFSFALFTRCLPSGLKIQIKIFEKGLNRVQKYLDFKTLKRRTYYQVNQIDLKVTIFQFENVRFIDLMIVSGFGYHGNHRHGNAAVVKVGYSQCYNILIYFI